MSPVKKAVLLGATISIFFLTGLSWPEVSGGRLPTFGGLVDTLKPNGTAKAPVQVFDETFSLVVRNAYAAEDIETMRYAAMEGMFSALGDPHTQFLDPEITRRLATETTGNFVGIGARLSYDPGGARVVSVISGTPAEEAGLMDDDLIVGVDSRAIAGQDVSEIVEQIVGEAGTPVVLEIVRRNVSEPISLRIIRRRIVLPSAEGKLLEDYNIGYIAVSSFSEPTSEQFESAWRLINASDPRGLVIDMRNNPGGLLQETVELLSMFFDRKVVVTMIDNRQSSTMVRTAPGRVRDIPYPIVVLIDEGSASAAEIFAGVMQQYQRATLIGQHTYGKASVQHVYPLPGMASAKITVAKYYLPGGEDISRRVDADGVYVSGGLTPDIEVPRFDPDIEIADRPTFRMGDPETDFQLAEAVRNILSKTGG